MTLTATCHCGAVRVEVPARPDALTDCNCSICRRTGALWALFPVGSIRVLARPEDLIDYVWGPKTIRTVRCRDCGCVTHWEPLQPQSDAIVGVNARSFDPTELGDVRIRHFDGAGTWGYVD